MSEGGREGGREGEREREREGGREGERERLVFKLAASNLVFLLGYLKIIQSI